MPDPTWIDLYFEEPGDAQGAILASFELIPKSSHSDKNVSSPITQSLWKSKAAAVERSHL